MAYEREKEIALAAVREAAMLCRAVRADMVSDDSLEKADRSPVTVADFGSQALICRRLQEAFSEDPVVGEEDAAELRKPTNASMLEHVSRYTARFREGVQSQDLCDWIDLGNGKVGKRFWTLDPIDGTKGFLRNDQYAVALALIEDGEVKVGALACPVLPVHADAPEGDVGLLFIAVRGQGTRVIPMDGGEEDSVRVVSEETQENWRFVESVESAHGNHVLQESVARSAGITARSLRMDSQAKYAAVARGEAVLYLRLPSSGRPGYQEKIWDHAAGALVVEEAGGRVSDVQGNALDFSSDYRMPANRGVVVSNGRVHEAVIQALNSAG